MATDVLKRNLAAFAKIRVVCIIMHLQAELFLQVIKSRNAQKPSKKVDILELQDPSNLPIVQ